MYDMHTNTTLKTLIGAATLSADNTPPACDLLNQRRVEIVLGIGAGGITFDGTNKIEFKLTHSDDNSTYVNVTDADMLGVSGISNGIIKALTAAHAAAAFYRYGYIGDKRYLKLLADFSGTHGTGTPIAAVAVCEPKVKPAANQA